MDKAQNVVTKNALAFTGAGLLGNTAMNQDMEMRNGIQHDLGHLTPKIDGKHINELRSASKETPDHHRMYNNKLDQDLQRQLFKDHMEPAESIDPETAATNFVESVTKSPGLTLTRGSYHPLSASRSNSRASVQSDLTGSIANNLDDYGKSFRMAIRERLKPERGIGIMDSETDRRLRTVFMMLSGAEDEAQKGVAVVVRQLAKDAMSAEWLGEFTIDATINEMLGFIN